jgi:nucleoside-diphosphate-sugar epimerase
MDLNGASLFITGGTGFFGKSILEYLQTLHDSGARFTAHVLSRDPNKFLLGHQRYQNQPWLTFVEGDLETLAPWRTFTHVIHAAADTHYSGLMSDWADQIVDGTRRVIVTAKLSGAKRLLLISSGAIYGSPSSEQSPIDEACRSAPSPLSLNSVYGNAKRFAETLCALESAEGGLECVIARCFAILSPHLPLDGPYAAGNFIRDALNPCIDTIKVKGDGSSIRTYLDGRDVAHWCIRILVKGEPGEAYNVGGDQIVTMKELAKKISIITGKEKTVEVESILLDQRSTYIPGIERAKALGLNVSYTLDESLENVIDVIRKQRNL